MRFCVLIRLLLGAPAYAAVAAEPAKVTYQDHVRAIFREHCLACHSQGDASSGLALDSYAATLAGGAGGEALAAGDANGSRLWRLVTHAESPVMPPGDKMPDEQLAVIKNWIDGGLLDNAGSKPQKAKRSGVAVMKITADNRPRGEPAMPEAWFRQPVVAANRVGPITSLATSAWAPLIAVPWQRQVSLYHAEDLTLIGVLPYLDGSPRVARFSRDGSLLLVAGGRGAKAGSAALFDVKSGERIATIGDELDEVLAADVSPDHALVAIGGPKKKVRVYRTTDGELAYELGKHTDWITALQFSPDGKLLATADRNSGLLLWQARTGNSRADLRGHKQAVTAVDWRADSAVLASASADGEARLWRRDGQPIKNFRASNGGVESVAFTRDGRIVTAGRDRRVTLWSGDGKETKRLGQMTDLALAVAVTSDDQRVVAADFAGRVRVFDAESGKPVNEIRPNPPTLAAQLADLTAVRTAIADELSAVTQKQQKKQARQDKAEAAHANFAKRFKSAEASAAEAAKRLKAIGEQVANGKTAVEEARRRIDAGKAVMAATQQALAVAREELANSGSDKESSEQPAVVASLLAAIDVAKQEVAEREKQMAAAEKNLRQDQAAASEAKNADEKATKLLAAVRSQKEKLPDLKAARQQTAAADAEVKRLREKLRASEAAIASLKDEQDRLATHVAQLAKEASDKNRQRDRLAEANAGAATTKEAAEAEVAAKANESAAIAGQIAELQERLAAANESAKQAEQTLAATKEKAASAARDFDASQRIADRAAQRHAEAVAVEQARKKYLQPSP